MDPTLVDIVEVRQIVYTTNDTKQLRPPGWETAFTVSAILGDSSGGSMGMIINLYSFMMNRRGATTASSNSSRISGW